jgi:hypothetical protein
MGNCQKIRTAIILRGNVRMFGISDSPLNIELSGLICGTIENLRHIKHGELSRALIN